MQYAYQPKAQMAHWVSVDELYLQETKLIRGSIVVSISPVTRKTRAQFPAAEITAAHGAAYGDGAVVRMLRTVTSCGPRFRSQCVSVEAAAED